MKTVGHWKQLQTTWCDPQTIVSKCWVTSKTYHYVLFFVGHYCFQVPHAPAPSGTRKTNTFEIVEMTNFSTVCIGKKYISSCDTNTIFLDMWALSSCNRRSWRWQQIAWRLRKCSLLNVNALHKNKEKKHVWFLYGKPFGPAAYVWLPISPNIGCGPRVLFHILQQFSMRGRRRFWEIKAYLEKG